MTKTRIFVPDAAKDEQGFNGNSEITEVKSEALTDLSDLLAVRRFDVDNAPPVAVPVYCLIGATIATAGNLVAVQAKAKSGKSAFTGAMMAATMDPTGDCLGITSSNPKGLAVVHFDTEQSPADHHAVMMRALRRAGRAAPPPWLRSYRLADLTLQTRCAALRFEMDRAAQEHGGLHSVTLDGLGDFCIDPNDPAEAFGLIDDLHQLAIRYYAPIACILHENPDSQSGKTRGHLGSQLERKAETNIRLEKDGEGVTVVFAEKARHAHIPRDLGPRFTWDEELQMHVSTTCAAAAKSSAKLTRLGAEADELFRDVPATVGLAWGEAHKRIEQAGEIKPEAARKRFGVLLDAGLIHKSADGRYRRSGG